jgi:hypothetical protein
MPFYDSPGFGEPSVFSDEVDGAKFLRADRSPCPVCGHPTGDCSGDSGPPRAVWGFNTGSLTLDKHQTFYLEEDVTETREIAPGVKTRVLVYPKGKHIPLEEAKRLGLI